MTLLLTSAISFAQSSGNITGTVVDAEVGDALIGVNVMVAGTTNGDATGSISAESGEYTKIGKQVTVRIAFTVGSNFTSNNIGGLPFTPSNETNSSSIQGVVPIFTESSGIYTFGRFQNNETIVRIYSTTSNNPQSPNSTRQVYRLSFTYFTS